MSQYQLHLLRVYMYPTPICHIFIMKNTCHGLFERYILSLDPAHINKINVKEINIRLILRSVCPLWHKRTTGKRRYSKSLRLSPPLLFSTVISNTHIDYEEQLMVSRKHYPVQFLMLTSVCIACEPIMVKNRLMKLTDVLVASLQLPLLSLWILVVKIT